jgi:hypothetical protein
MDNNNNLIGRYRLILTDHFDSVTSEIDFFIETELLVNVEDELKLAWIEKKREILLKYVKYIEQVNMKYLNEHLVNNLECLAGDISGLFVIFCFVFTYNNEIRLVVTDEYISAKELKLFKKAIDVSFTGEWNINRQLADQLFKIQPTPEPVS